MNKILYHPKEGTTGFFLGDFPDEPIDHNVYPRDTWNMIYEDYKRILLKCKEEAIKNGEIINPELLLNHVNKHGGWSIGNDVKLDGDIFDLPEGVNIKKEFKTPTVQYVAECSDKGIQPETVIRLVPSNKEDDHCPFSDMIKNSKQESQDELMDDLLSQYFLMIKNGASMYTASNNLQNNFTITRKEK